MTLMIDFPSAAALSVGLFFGMLLCLEGGFRLGLRHGSAAADAHEGIGVIEAAIFALLGLLLGFAFGGAMSRLDGRRDLIVHETNAIGTAYLRLDLLSAVDQPVLRHLFRDYLRARIRVYENMGDLKEAERYLAEAAQLQQQIWALAVRSSGEDVEGGVARLVLPALNDMIDVNTARTLALRTRLPTLILVLLVFVALLSALIAGYAMAKRRNRSALHMFLYAACVSMTVYAILDLDDPGFGLIRLRPAEQILQQLHDSIR